MKGIILILFVIHSIVAGAQSPRSLPDPYPANAPVNYIRTWDALAPETDPNNLTLATTPEKARITTQYFDGLGRPIQTVVKQGSLISGGTATDIVSTTLYDDLGRVSYQYLPFAANSAGGNTSIDDGLFKLNPFQQQEAFYNDPDGTLKDQGESFFYGYTKYEASPLSRVEETFAPGNNWAGTSENTTEGSRRSVKMKYWINTAKDSVRIWNVTNHATPGNFGSYSSPGAYSAGQLYKNATADEHGKQVIEFKDREGQVVLKKVQLTAAVDTGAGSGHTGWLCTYYIYDALNQLRCVVQPEGVIAISANWQLTNTAILAEQCFRYEYDHRQRMIVKKVPGAGEVNMVYDKRDRLAMTQNANMQAGNQWLISKYDALNRPVETGLWTNSSSANYHRDSAMNLSQGEYDYPATSSNYEELTHTWYDSYDWVSTSGSPITNSNYESVWDTCLLPASTTEYPYPVTNAKSDRTKGMITGSKTKILGTSDYLYSIVIYDDKGRIIQTKSTNITEGVDVVTTQYGWQGLPLVTVVETHGRESQPSETLTMVTKNIYDKLGRIVKTEKRQAHSSVGAGAMSDSTIISKLEYDALGQVNTKMLAPEYDNDGGLETLTYDYNIRGWLLGANRDYARDANEGHYFGFDLGYDKTDNNLIGDKSYAAAQYNGNISGTVWKSKGDQEKRKYDFTYDAVNRITGADFNQFTGSAFNKTAQVDFSVNGLTYDANGNILSMNQYGLKINNSSPIDQLSYSYQSNSNKLEKVTDAINDYTSTLGDFKYDDGTKGSIDYTYDANGNLISDANKAISSNTYNYLNLPGVITVAGKGTITYTYDAAGNKLKKITQENDAAVGYNDINYTTNIITTSLYIGGAVYESKAYSHSNLSSLQYTDELQFIAHEEGRLRPVKDAGNNITGFTYDYFLKDHLGNIRMVITAQKDTSFYPAVTFEDANLTNEEKYYDNVDAQREVRPGAFYSSGTNGSKVQLLRKSIQSKGAGQLLKVMAGDRLHIKTDYYIPSQTTDNSTANGLNTIINALTSIIENNPVTGALHGNGSVITNSLNANAAFTTFLAPQNGSGGTTMPKAYLNIMFFDEQFKFVTENSEAVQVTTEGSGQMITRIAGSAKEAVKNGYAYIYVSNESDNLVYFDNLQVTHERGQILEETHYYPFGLTMAGISSKALQFGGAENRYKYNGIEYNADLDLNMYDAFYRNLDPQIGRFWQPDPETDYLESYSPYESMGNNPVSNIDPLGNFRTRFGAWWHSLWNGGDVGKNEFGEYYVIKSEDGDDEKGVIVTYTYGKGRDKYSNAREALLRDYKIMDDIRQNGENSMFQMYDSPEEAGNAALSSGAGVVLPSPIIKSGTIALNTTKAANAAKNTIKKLLNAGNSLDKGGLSAAGRALQKHGSRAGSIFPKATGNASAINAQGEKVLNEIITNPSVTTVTRHHARFGNVLEYKLPSGQGARFSADGSKFIGFIEP